MQTIDSSDLVKKTDYNTKINETENKVNGHGHDKCITTKEVNKLMSENFDARLKLANLASKNDISDFAQKRVLMIN